jgi:F-type H+-transporting ATPase subunit gamma
VRDYAEQLKAMLPPLLPELETGPGILERLRERLPLPAVRSGRKNVEHDGRSGSDRIEALVIGSERGLCGRFNMAIANETERYLRRRSTQGGGITLRVLGSRAQRVLGRRGYEAEPAGTLSVTTLPSLSLAFGLARRWLAAYEMNELDEVDLIYNDYRGTGSYESTVTRLIPPQLPREEPPFAPQDGSPGGGTSWPPPIIDTDPMSLYATVVEQWTAVQLYNVLLDSAAAEHSTRFQLMESATQNADQLVADLTLVIQTARRQEITQEMAEMAAGAGLLGKRKEA